MLDVSVLMFGWTFAAVSVIAVVPDPVESPDTVMDWFPVSQVEEFTPLMTA